MSYAPDIPFATVAETARESICIVDESMRILFANARFGALVQRAPEGVIGESLGAFLAAQAFEGWRTGGAHEERVEIARAGVAPLVVETSSAPIGDGRALIMFTDVTREREAEEALSHARDVLSARLRELQGAEAATGDVTAELARTHGDLTAAKLQIDDLARRIAHANEELETFAFAVSHDLRAPLRAIDGFTRELQSLCAESVDDRARRYMARVRAAAERMMQLIDDLLGLARLSTLPLRSTEVNVTAMVHDIIAGLPESAPPVTWRVSPSLRMTADPALLRVALGNLIGNAVKFSSRSEHPSISVRCDGGELMVSDNGVGFDPEQTSQMFSPFQRFHADFEGTGIGLALVHRVVRRHGGTLRAESKVGEGATFAFTTTTGCTCPDHFHG